MELGQDERSMKIVIKDNLPLSEEEIFEEMKRLRVIPRGSEDRARKLVRQIKKSSR